MLGLYQVASGLADCGGKRTPEPYLREDVLIPMWSADLQKDKRRKVSSEFVLLVNPKTRVLRLQRFFTMPAPEQKHETLRGKT